MTNKKTLYDLAKANGFDKSPIVVAKNGLYANIHAKRARIAAGSGERMRKPGEKGAPTAKQFVQAAKTAKAENGMVIEPPVNPLEGNIISNVLMNRNRDKDFVQRAYGVGAYPQSNMFSTFADFDTKATHMMGTGADERGQEYMFPTTLNPKNEDIKVPNQYANFISEYGYKNATGMNPGGKVVNPENDPYKKFYDMEVKSLAQSPAWRAYTMERGGSYNPISRIGGQHPNWQWDENTGFGYMLDENKKMLGSIPIEGEKSMNLPRFLVNPYMGNMMVTGDLELKKSGERAAPFKVGKTAEEINENIFQDLYTQNLVKNNNNREKAYAETLATMKSRVEPMVGGPFMKFMTDPNVNKNLKRSVDPYGQGMSVDYSNFKNSLRQGVGAIFGEQSGSFGSPEWMKFYGINPQDSDKIKAKKMEMKIDEALPAYYKQMSPVLIDHLVNFKGMPREQAVKTINDLLK